MDDELVLCVDFEAAGGNFKKNGFTQLGASIHVLKTGDKIAGFNEYSNMKGKDWDKKCVDEFWINHPKRYKETLEKIEESPYTCEEVVVHFIEWMKKHIGDKKHIVISDNLVFDIGLLGCYFDGDIMYLLGGSKRTIYFETSSVYYGMHSAHKRVRLCQDSDMLSSKEIALDVVKDLNEDHTLQYPKRGVNHDHNPENDATSMGEKWCFIQNSIHKVKDD